MKTKYILLKKCLQCMSMNPKETRICTACGHLFTEEATLDEYEQIMEKFNQK